MLDTAIGAAPVYVEIVLAELLQPYQPVAPHFTLSLPAARSLNQHRAIVIADLLIEVPALGLGCH
jgi:hypothetical protein